MNSFCYRENLTCLQTEFTAVPAWTLLGHSAKRELSPQPTVACAFTLRRYETARKIKEEQDEYCSLALAGKWDQVASSFPDNLQWEALVDVLRGRVKVQNAVLDFGHNSDVLSGP